MGNDGGTIAKRLDLLSLHSKNRSKISEESLEDSDNSKLMTCALTSLPLYNSGVLHISSDYKGNLFLKDKVLEYIIKNKNSRRHDSKFNHIRSLSDLLDIKPFWKIDGGRPILECPVTNLQGEKLATFAYLRPCGCVLSFKLLDGLSKHFKTSEIPVKSECPYCHKEMHFDYDIVIINPMNNEAYSLYNQRNKDYLSEVLKMTHSKKQKKSSSTKSKRKRQEENKEDYEQDTIASKKSKSNC